MKRVLQSIRSGQVFVSEVPAPQVRPAGVLVRTAASLISPGTERAALEFSRMSLLGKARSRPDLVRQVLDKVRRDGFVEAARVALARLDQPAPLGYACAGTVMAVGADAGEFAVGDRVACAGAGYAAHAEVNYVPRNLVVPIPRLGSGGWLSFEEASFATLGAIALHAVRLGHPGAGDRAVVIGLGLVGLLAAQVLRAHGCAVLGVEPNPARRALAQELGIEETTVPEAAVEHVAGFTRGIGADLVLIAAATEDNGPARLAGEVARDRATVVAVGATGLDLPRRSYYRKELSVVVARSYGPGRYDPDFEERGQDYPIGYVRWTERENMRAFLELTAHGRVRVAPLVSHRVPIAEAERAYALLDDPGTLGVVLEYPPASADEGTMGRGPARIGLKSRAPLGQDAVGLSVIGAGAFARGVLLPILGRFPGVTLRGVVTGSGLGARVAGERFGFSYCASTADAVWDDPDTHAVIIATRHHLHAGLVERALSAGKAVFVEKPLCLTADELDGLIHAFGQARSPLVAVGFNRRFAPLVQALRAALEPEAAPLTVHYRVNAGRLPEGSWLADPKEGGGRILGEVCHFVDLAAFLVGAPAASVVARSGGGSEDDIAVTLTFADGSLAVIGYSSRGDRAWSKERIEVFGGGAVAVVDDFRRGWIVRDGRRRRFGRWWRRRGKGHREELVAFVEAVRTGGPSPVPFEEAVATTRATLAIRESLGRGGLVDLTL